MLLDKVAEIIYRDTGKLLSIKYNRCSQWYCSCELELSLNRRGFLSPIGGFHNSIEEALCYFLNDAISNELYDPKIGIYYKFEGRRFVKRGKL